MKDRHDEVGRPEPTTAEQWLARLAFLSADHALEAQLRMELEVLFRTTNGGIPVRCMTSKPAHEVVPAE